VSPGTLVSINVSNGGVPKAPVPRAAVSATGVEGDRQRDLRYHGGPDRAVCLYAMERIAALRLEGHPIDVGTTGENLTVSGLDWNGVGPGTRLRVGETVVEVTSYAAPCKNIGGSFAGGNFGRISQKTHAGWSRIYARVLAGGQVRVGDAVELAP
jgi:MOSC domain-containing protein YiiM